MPDRRTFLITSCGAVAVPAVAHFALPLATRTVPAPFAVAPPTLALRIDGWESATDSGDAWVQINSSWRANWR